jgi:hypothetical protein
MEPSQSKSGGANMQQSWRTITIGDEFNSMFKNFNLSAYRLETLQAYAEQSESSPFNLYRRGVKPDPSFMADWCQMVRDHISAGRSMRRVHVVDLPLSQYMRFEIECCYCDTGKAGEEIRLLDRAKLPAGLSRVALEDFWFFDGCTVMINDYDQNGTIVQARISSVPKVVEQYAAIDQQIWDLSVPFREFYLAQTGVDLELINSGQRECRGTN